MSRVIAQQKTEDSIARRHDEASRWYVLLQHAELSPRLLRAWKKWEAVPENRDEFDFVVRLCGKLDILPPPPMPSRRERAADQYDGSTPILPSYVSVPETTRAIGRRIVLATVAAAAMMVVGVVGLRWVSSLIDYSAVHPQGHYVSAETGVAEHRQLLLADGSLIYLGAQTLLTADFTAKSRKVVLHRGEALFEVAHDSRRPFRVSAGRGDITAVGTKFNVLRRDDHVVVTVTDGIVEVSSRIRRLQRETGAPAASSGDSELPVRRLTRGQQIGFDPNGRFSDVRLASEHVSATWRDGKLTYRGEPLRHVLEDVNRYSRRQVILGDSAAGELLYSGTVFERYIADWVAALEKTYPELQVVTTDDGHIVLHTRASAEIAP